MSQLIDEYLLDAVAIISWETPDEDFADAVNAQARLMAGFSPDDVWRYADDSPYPTY